MKFKATKNDVGLRISNFIAKINPEWNWNTINKLLRKKKIKVNNKKVDSNYKLALDDEISIFIAFRTEQPTTEPWKLASSQIDVVYEDNNIIIVNKPIGVAVYDEQQKAIDTLINRITKYLYENKQYHPELENVFKPALAHRIDTNTTGLVIAAKNAASLRELNTFFKEKMIKKTYIALTYGLIKPTQNTIKCYIKKLDNNLVDAQFEQKDNNYKEAITKYKLINYYKNKYSLVEIDLLTGRTHQIRASFNLINFPLLGEQKYIKKNVDKNPQWKHQCLCSYKLKFPKLPTTWHLSDLSNKEFSLKKIWFLDEQ